MTIFTGGLLQFIAGMWQFPRGDVFGATVFSIYGAFWMSYSMILLPGTGILASYSDSRELANAMGIYLITWFVVTIFLSLPTIRRNFAFTIFLSILSVTFLCLAVGEFTGGASATRGGGVTGIMTAIVAYYIGISELLAAEPRPIMKLPQGHWYA
ncbi:GPR1/FUN34/yaaH family-domain-containing protein [Gymnopilus junonius]|uniref:GPR1/FUN34/yaaH family-domain-containing protein n=1 Tax=Gymnopilus junonius TaxID=109634 RepID=A0A9P5TK31_GYMJU|nr:GPR1/FUN34/yaaH family-domain-containing protein [Gymnopilus junonius]